jgi:hypothetical protein
LKTDYCIKKQILQCESRPLSPNEGENKEYLFFKNPIGALNSARIGEKVELKRFQNFCLERSGKVWKELKK